jgi:hypothetical protein
MPSLVWDRSFQEAYDNPYEYEVQNQFAREANSLLNELNTILQKYSMKFHINDKSIKKAIWMLQLDGLDSLKDALEALKNKNHRVTGKLFRDVVETLDLAAFFHSNTKESNDQLNKWYDDEIIPHQKYRDFIRKSEGEEVANEKKEYYSDFSKFTHRSYSRLKYGYGLGKEDFMWHDGYSDVLILPQTISMYYAILAKLIIKLVNELTERGLFSEEEIKSAINKSIDSNTIPRRFMSKSS